MRGLLGLRAEGRGKKKRGPSRLQTIERGIKKRVGEVLRRFRSVSCAGSKRRLWKVHIDQIEVDYGCDARPHETRGTR